MVRKLEITVPAKHSNEIRDVLMMNRSVHHLSYRKCITCSESHNGAQIESVLFSFMCVNKKTHELIELLTRYGVSSRFGHFNVSALTSTKPRVATIKEVRSYENDPFNTSKSSSSATVQKSKKKRKYRISDSLAYDEVYDTIDGQLHLTFDYLALIFVGGLISAIGLLTNSAVAVVASMLVSPLMGPIVGMTFGTIIKDKTMLWKSFRNELIGVFVCFLTGALMGFITAPIMDRPYDAQLAFGVNTQISSRGEWIALAWGAGIAAPSGVGVALGVSSDQVSALIGVAISAALLPPIVNSGICLASAFLFWINPKYNNEIVQKWWSIGYISMLLFVLNWILIFIFGILTFRAKKLHESANEQMKMERLNKFYEMRDKVEQEEEFEQSQGNVNVQVAIKGSVNSENDGNNNNLKIPLLSNANNYSENSKLKSVNIESQISEINSTSISNSLNNKHNKNSMDGVPNMLATLSARDTGVHGGNGKDDMINWDKKSRNQRFMSAVTPTQLSMSQKRKVKRSSLDASFNLNVSMNSSKSNLRDNGKGSDDII